MWIDISSGVVKNTDDFKDVQTCISREIFISRKICVIVSVRPVNAFTAAEEILFTKACDRFGSKAQNQPVFPANNVQNVYGIRIARKPDRWPILSAKLKKARKRSAQK